MVGVRILMYDSQTLEFVGYWECVLAPVIYEHDGKWVYHDLVQQVS